MIQKRRFTKEFKLAVVQELETKSIAEVCREHSLASSTVSGWRKDYESNPQEAFKGQGNVWKQEAKIARYERLLGELYAENALLKKSLRAVESTQGRGAEREVKRKMIQNSNLPISNACSALSLSRSSYYSWKPVEASVDLELRSAIREIALEFPGYGYRRITVALHRQNTIVNKVKTKMQNGFEHWFTCILYPEVEPTNNRAERMLREQVVLRKITGTLRNEKGTTANEVLMSLITTWKQQNKNPFLELCSKLSTYAQKNGSAKNNTFSLTNS